MPDVTMESVLAHAEEVLYRDLDGEAVIVDLKSGTYFGLDPVGTRIWVALEEPGPLRRALEVVLEEFEVTEEVASADILRLAGEMIGKGLLHPVPGGK